MKHKLIAPCPARQGDSHCWEEHDAPVKYPRLHSIDGSVWVHKFCCHCGEKFEIEIKRSLPAPPVVHGPFAADLPPAA